jgi:adenine-specific DNA glycosylase
LAGLWGLPVGEGETQEEALRALLDYMDEMFDLQVGPGRKGHSAEHIFTHRVWAMTGYHFEVSESPAVEYPVNRILKLEEFDQLAIPTAFQKIIKKGSR